MSGLDQLRRNLRVMELFTQSFEAHSRGDIAASDRLSQEALKADLDVVSALSGGMVIGEVPNPERDWDAWLRYVDAARDKLARAETQADGGNA